MTGPPRGPAAWKRWIKLAEGVEAGSRLCGEHRRQATTGHQHFAVDAYEHSVRERSLLEAVASSTAEELFSPTIIAERVSGMLASYD